MRNFLYFLIGVGIILLLTDIHGRKDMEIDIEVEHWKIQDHYVHVVTFKTDSVQKIADLLSKYDPYLYKSKVEIRFVTETLPDYHSKFNEIKSYLRREATNR